MNQILSIVALVVAAVALGCGIWAVLTASRKGWARESRRLREELDADLAKHRRELVELREEWTAYGDKLTKRYRNAARALAELNRRGEENSPEPEPDDVPDDDGATRANGRVQSLPAHVVASGAFGAGRAG